MRSLCAAIWMTVAMLCISAMAWMIFGVLSQPLMASERTSITRSGITSPGIIGPYRPSQAPYRIYKGTYKGYANQYGTIRLRTYDRGNYLLTTGRIGNSRIRFKEYKKLD
jgi:hypothetical protein